MNDELSKRAAGIAMKSAAEWLNRNDVDMAKLDYTRATEIIREELRSALPAALADAKEAIDANMADVAVATFAASMRLAGISAAKKIKG